MAKHKHHWMVCSWCGKEVTYRCKCGEEFTRKMTAEERKRQGAWLLLREPRATDVHHVWHKVPFPKSFETMKGQDKKIEAGDAIEKFAKRYPGEVIPLWCDDSYFAGSRLFLFTHEAERKWMGVTVVMIPQCDGRPPAEFFLYPHHVDDLVRELRKIQKRSKNLAALEAKDAKASTRWWNARANPPREVKEKAHGESDDLPEDRPAVRAHRI